MNIDELFHKIAESYEILQGIAKDEQGVYHIEMDDVVIAFKASEDGERMISWAELGPLPEKDRILFFRTMLEESFLGMINDGAFFALQGDMFVLMRVDALAGAELSRPMEIAASLAKCAKPWIERLEEVNHDAE